MKIDRTRLLATQEWSFTILRAMAMLGGMVALFLVPLRPEHQPHLAPLAWAFVAYKALLFLSIWVFPARLRAILLGTVVLDLLFIALFVWFSGGMASHFYILFYLQIALVAVHFSPATGFMTAAGASVLYWLASIPYPLDFEWHHLGARIVTFFLLSGALGYLSQRERQARAEAERLNQELRESQARLQVAYEALQAAQDKLVQAERLATIGQMAAKISHEVRNPLGAISLNTELLEDELLVLPEERRAEAATLVGAIKSQLDILSAVTEEYLRFARLPRPRLEPTLLPPVIEDLVNLVKGEFLARGVNISTNIASGLPALRLDPGQIRQVLLNLLRNAAEAMPDGGTARITAALRNNSSAQLADSSLSIADSTIRPINKSDFIEIAVEDTGVGIAPENLEKIFDPFFTTKEGGTGLGLAIARQIISDHGGTLTCESVPRQGTAFRLTLPIPEGEKIP